MGCINQNILRGLGFKVLSSFISHWKRYGNSFLVRYNSFICNTQTSKGKNKKGPKRKKKKKNTLQAACFLKSIIMYNNFLIFQKKKIMDVARRILWERRNGLKLLEVNHLIVMHINAPPLCCVVCALVSLLDWQAQRP
jgi:hypothetical protein